MPENEPNWQEVEKSVNQAEEAQRQADQASADIYDATGETKEERASLEIENSSRVLKKATEREGFFDEEAKKILGAKESPQNELVRLRWNNLISALRAEREIEKKKQALLDEESDIIKQPEKTPSSSELDAIDEIRQEKDELDAQRQQLLESTPEAYFGLHLKELKEYQRGLHSARIVETSYVRSQIDDIVTHFRAGKPVMIYGHLGTGKTEIALHIAKKNLGKEALVISGSKHTTLAELYGHHVLSLKETRHEEIETYVRQVEDKYNQWLEKNKTKLDEMPAAEQEGEKNRAHDRFLQTFLSAHQGGTVSDFFMGPIYRAMEEGRPVIIDEVNAIPHEVLISLNHILTRRPGETINVQQDSGRTITIKDGFGVMMTGNLNQGQEKYIDREDLDPAFLSRLYKIEHDYLPQRKEGGLDETDGSDEQFSLVLSMLMDKNGNLDLPQGSVRQLWRLSKAARVFQDIFAGREVEGAYYQQAGENSVVYFLKESVLSLRAMDLSLIHI